LPKVGFMQDWNSGHWVGKSYRFRKEEKRGRGILQSSENYGGIQGGSGGRNETALYK